jgi:hypothetical protein
MQFKRTGNWKQVGAILGKGRKDIKTALALSIKSEAVLAAKHMRKCIVTGGKSNGVKWPKLSPWTAKAKGSTSKLRETRVLFASIKARRVGVKWVAGPSPTGGYINGKTIEQITQIHEEGAMYWVEVTRRMAAFLAIRAKELNIAPKKSGKIPVGASMLIVIPKRSFIQSTKDAHFGTLKVTKRFVTRTFTTSSVVKFFKKFGK